MKIVKDHIVEAKFTWGWEQSGNCGADGLYTEAGAKKRAKQQMKKNPGRKYRAEKVKVKK